MLSKQERKREERRGKEGREGKKRKEEEKKRESYSHFTTVVIVMQLLSPRFWRLYPWGAYAWIKVKPTQLGDGQDTRNLNPYVMLYRVYQADGFQKLMKGKEGFAQADETIHVVTMVPHTFFLNWYALLPCIRFVVHLVLDVQAHS